MGWADLTTLDAKINGFFSFVTVGLGIILFLHLIIRYRQIKRNDILITAFALVSLGCVWLGGATSFIRVILTGSPLGPKAQTLLFSWAPAVTATLWVYLGFRLAKPEFQNYALGGMLVVGAVHLFGAYVIVPRAIPEVTAEGVILGGLVFYRVVGNMAYTNYRSLLLGTTLIFVLSSAFLVGPLFLRMSRITDRAETRVRSQFIGFGALLLGFAVIFDEVFTFGGFFNILGPLAIVVSMVLLYLGYLLPPGLRRLTHLE